MRKINPIIVAFAAFLTGFLVVTYADRAEGASKYSSIVAPPPNFSIVEIADIHYSSLFLIIDEETGNHYIAYGDSSGESASIIPRLNGQEYYVEDVK